MSSNKSYATLRALISSQIEELAQTATRCSERLARRQEFAATGAEDILADSLASCLHSFYTGLESLLEAVAADLDELPDGAQWHKRLLQVMSMEVEGVRPAVLSRESYEALDDFRAFRHLFRNLYTHNLKPERVFELAQVLTPTWRLVHRDLVEFGEFLGGAGGEGAA